MLKHTYLLSGLLGLMTINGQAQAKTIHYLHNDDWFSSMHQSMRSMHERMIKSMQEMQHVFDELSQSAPMGQIKSAEKQALSLDANDTQVLITLDVPRALAESMKAERNLDTIVIEIPQEEGRTTMRISAHALSVEQVLENKQDTGSRASSHSYIERTLPHVIDMSGDISIEHVEETNTLQVTVERKHKKKAPQQLPITKK